MDRWDQDCHLWLCVLGCEQVGAAWVRPFLPGPEPKSTLVLLAACGAAIWSQSRVWLTPRLPGSLFIIYIPFTHTDVRAPIAC